MKKKRDLEFFRQLYDYLDNKVMQCHEFKE